MNITVTSDRGSKFSAFSIEGALKQSIGYLLDHPTGYVDPDVYRVYVHGKDVKEPWPGWVAATVRLDEEGQPIVIRRCCERVNRTGDWNEGPGGVLYCSICNARVAKYRQ